LRKEIRVGDGDTSGVFDFDPACGHAGYGKGHGNAVVVVGLAKGGE
jgi:hypothetical protein